jgi:hypothetical protein
MADIASITMKHQNGDRLGYGPAVRLDQESAQSLAIRSAY